MPECFLKEEDMNNEQLVVRIRAGENTAENMLRLWQQNTGFISKCALKYSGYAELDDLKQEGYIGLCEAVRHYDMDTGVMFISYAAFWIKQAMRRYVENCGNVIRIPVHAQQNIREYKKVLTEYRKCYGKEPTEWELQCLLGVDGEKVSQIRKTAQMVQIRSLSEPLAGEDSEIELQDTITSGEDMEMDTVQRLDFQNMQSELWAAVDNLPEEQARVIRCRFISGKTLKETAELLSVPVNTARQTEYKAMRTLRHPTRCRKFRDYNEQYLSAASIHHVGLASFKTTWTSEVERDALGRW